MGKIHNTLIWKSSLGRSWRSARNISLATKGKALQIRLFICSMAVLIRHVVVSAGEGLVSLCVFTKPGHLQVGEQCARCSCSGRAEMTPAFTFAWDSSMASPVPYLPGASDVLTRKPAFSKTTRCSLFVSDSAPSPWTVAQLDCPSRFVFSNHQQALNHVNGAPKCFH